MYTEVDPHRNTFDTPNDPIFFIYVQFSDKLGLLLGLHPLPFGVVLSLGNSGSGSGIKNSEFCNYRIPLQLHLAHCGVNLFFY